MPMKNKKTMTVDRLTEKAKNLLNTLPNKKTVKVEDILSALSNTTGVGKYLLTIYPSLEVDTYKRISIDDLLKESYYQALKLDHSYIGTEHLLLALLKLLKSPSYLRVKIEFEKVSIFPQTFKSEEPTKKTPILDGFSENLTSKFSKKFDKPLVSREEYNNMISVLLQKDNNNVLLVGDAGVGKNSIIELLARNLNTLDVPASLLGYQVYEFDIMGYTSHLFTRGSLESGINALYDEIKQNDKVILYFKSFQNLFFTSVTGFTVPILYTMLKSAFEGTRVRIIGTINPSLYEKISTDNAHFLDDFTIVDVDEPEDLVTMEILNRNAEYYSNFHNVTITTEVLKKVFTRAKNKIKDIKFPQKALVLLDQACARLVMKRSKVSEEYKDLIDKTYLYAKGLDTSIGKGDYTSATQLREKLRLLEKDLLKKEKTLVKPDRFKLTLTDVEEAVEEMGSELPTRQKKTLDNLQNLPLLSDKIKKRVIGQDSAIEVTVKSLVRSMLGLRARKRPLGNFLFLGQTGVGKTELAKVLSDEVFGTGSLIRLDMSDFSEKHTVARLVGAPPGYVGYGEGGELTQKISERPESLVLFDEIEKAHPDVLNILLQIMEEGELSDAKGNTFDFSKAIIVLTSNLGTEILHNKSIGFDESGISDESVEGRLKLNLKKIMKPELLNRFDETIVFNRLKKEHLSVILDKMFTDFEKIINDQAVFIKVPKKIREEILKRANTQEYGARALRRSFEKEIIDTVADTLLKDKSRPLKILFQVAEGKIVTK